MTSTSLSALFNRPITTTFRFKNRSDEINNKNSEKTSFDATVHNSLQFQSGCTFNRRGDLNSRVNNFAAQHFRKSFRAKSTCAEHYVIRRLSTTRVSTNTSQTLFMGKYVISCTQIG